jgi:hypothetical protein
MQNERCVKQHHNDEEDTKQVFKLMIHIAAVHVRIHAEFLFVGPLLFLKTTKKVFALVAAHVFCIPTTAFHSALLIPPGDSSKPTTKQTTSFGARAR